MRLELLPLEDRVSESGSQLTGRNYTSKASGVWNDAQKLSECTMHGKEVGRTSQGLVSMRPLTIVVTIGSIYRESRIMLE